MSCGSMQMKFCTQQHVCTNAKKLGRVQAHTIIQACAPADMHACADKQSPANIVNAPHSAPHPPPQVDRCATKNEQHCACTTHARMRRRTGSAGTRGSRRGRGSRGCGSRSPPPQCACWGLCGRSSRRRGRCAGSAPGSTAPPRGSAPPPKGFGCVGQSSGAHAQACVRTHTWKHTWDCYCCSPLGICRAHARSCCTDSKRRRAHAHAGNTPSSSYRRPSASLMSPTPS